MSREQGTAKRPPRQARQGPLKVMNAAGSGAKRKTKRAAKGKVQGALEVPGLLLLALGFLLLGLLLPLPTGELGALARGALVGTVGFGAYLLPWPPLVLGGLFLLRQAPKAWPRLTLGYAVCALGVWLLGSLLVRAAGGGWGDALRSGVGGATGVLAVIVAVLIIFVGVDLFLALTPTTLIRRGTHKGVAGVQRAVHGGLRVRRDVRSRAAFGADVALVRKRLKGLSADLGALGELYPGSAELEHWRSAAKTAHANLRYADAPILEHTETDVVAWEEAVGGFTDARAAELRGQIGDEGLRGFEGTQADLGDALAEPFADRTLDGLRKVLGLEHTALGERYNRLVRDREGAAEALREADAKGLVRASRRHAERLAQFREVSASQAALVADAALLAPWADLLGRVDDARADLPNDPALAAFGAELHKGLQDRSRLGELEAQTGAFDTLTEALGVVAAPPETSIPPAAKPVNADDNDTDDDFGVPWDAPEAEAGDPGTDAPEDGYEDDSETDSGTDAEPIPEVGGIPIQLPPLTLLDAPAPSQDDPAARGREVRARITKIDETLANFRLQGRVVASVRGPTVTRFEVEPAPGEKISRFSGLSDDLALAMAVGSVRIEAPIPGKSVIGLEVPNAHRDLIRFREAAESPVFRRAKARLPLILGKSIDGEMVVGDLSRMPHLLIAGSTGSGKSVAVNTLIGSLLYHFLPTDLRFLMIDPKMVELTPFDGVPHLLRPVVTNPNDAAGVLLGLVAHMERRYKMMSKIGAKNLHQYNQKAKTLDLPELPFIVIIIDELADLMITAPKEVESAIMRLAQMARATGMHLVLATQRPSVDILTSLIKVNVPARVAFAVSSGHDSRTILDTMGAERLTGMGDMLFYQPGLVKPVRLQGPFISEDEIYTLAAFLRRQYFDDDFVEAYGSDFDPPPLDESSASGLIDWDDDKLREAAELVIRDGYGSVSRLQRRLSVGHARAGKLMDSLEALAVVGPHVGSKPRDVLVAFEELPNIFGK